MDVGEFIKKTREEKGISARELSRRSKVSQPYISQIENGDFENPSRKIISKLAKGLNISEVHLLHMAGYLNRETFDVLSDVKNILDNNEWKDVTHEMKDKIISLKKILT